MDKYELAKKLDKTYRDYDIFQYRDADYNEMVALSAIENIPDIVIGELCDIIEDLLAERE